MIVYKHTETIEYAKKYNPPIAEHPNQWAIVEKIFYLSIDY